MWIFTSYPALCIPTYIVVVGVLPATPTHGWLATPPGPLTSCLFLVFYDIILMKLFGFVIKSGQELEFLVFLS